MLSLLDIKCISLGNAPRNGPEIARIGITSILEHEVTTDLVQYRWPARPCRTNARAENYGISSANLCVRPTLSSLLLSLRKILLWSSGYLKLGNFAIYSLIQTKTIGLLCCFKTEEAGSLPENDGDFSRVLERKTKNGKIFHIWEWEPVQFVRRWSTGKPYYTNLEDENSTWDR
eukprot:9803-Amorphochlora_amoeboformis.AAC.2